ncbi:hypothetical protein M1N61_03015 [Peptococcaceae bacterium]|nr:hypothetical protein [Peptococcaceae bacterium]
MIFKNLSIKSIHAAAAIRSERNITPITNNIINKISLFNGVASLKLIMFVVTFLGMIGVSGKLSLVNMLYILAGAVLIFIGVHKK